MVLPMSRSTRPVTRLVPEITLSSRRRVAPAAASSEAAEVPSVPAHFRCPISLDLMRDPVTAPTGITYDRESVEGWLARGNATCPVTGRGPLRAADLVPNHATRRMIQAWCVANKAERVPTPRAPLADADAAEAVGAIVSAAAANNAAACGAAAARARALARESERDRRCLAAAGAARALAAAFARLSSSSSGGNGVVSAAALGEVLAALTVFFPLDGEARRCIVASPTALESLVLVMSRGELTGRTSAAIVLRELTSSADPGSAVVEAVSETPGLCDALVSLVRHPVSPQATKAALVTAYYLVSSSSNRISTAAAHRLAPLVPVVLELLVDADKGTSEKALAALDGVLRAADAGRAAAAGHALAVPVLVKKMFRVSDMATEFAVSALWRLCRDDDGEACRAEALRVGAFQKLLLLLQVGCGGVTKERASDLLKMLNGSRGSVECIETVDFKGLKRPF